MNYNRALQVLKARGLEVLGYAGGPELAAPQYGARANMDRILGVRERAARQVAGPQMRRAARVIADDRSSSMDVVSDA